MSISAFTFKDKVVTFAGGRRMITLLKQAGYAYPGAGSRIG